MKEIKTLSDVKNIKVNSRRIYSANHDEILAGMTTDIYFIKTMEILRHMGLSQKEVVAEVFPRRSGVMCGTQEVLNLLQDKDVEIYALPEGETFEAKDTVMRIIGPYEEFGIYETVLLGMLAHSSAWATAARECREAAGEVSFICFGARHVHPAVAPVMERAAIIGGANNASCILAAKLLGREPSGTIPHAAMLVAGDTVSVAKTYNEIMPADSPRIILVDTFKDEAEEALNLAEALGKDLEGIRLDTPSERGGVTPALVHEIRNRLNQKGYDYVKIFVSGGLTPERIKILLEAGADAFGVGSYISGATPIDMTMDLKMVDGTPIAKRGRIPGLKDNPKLKRLKLRTNK
ncbi:MAG TPA: nicotinate phosphoribosyltransferase [Thermoanaerobacterales bacterium]|uniref:nicotinate phosphoribosyltransferase n=1 Tax=Tepidanaerobacter sp. GT38 TaxID=2722793 RepID=UPI0018041BAB|nr:nicotinate phosphoribosyltransferase [Tepidanaerobacter sp. GT38]MCG1011937.1 nicotinate phosphoribosyltransferase [Tepidanaerobacter sp. GT38]HHY41234.1 nicotinate phosphoribosyltransferase [Thermoanaerobacterales bacterium]